MSLTQVELKSTLYLPDESFWPAETEISELEAHAMDLCFDYAQEALEDGNPPIGAVLLYHNPETKESMHWAAKTIDKTVPDLNNGHAEKIAYNLAQPIVGDRLETCTLVTSSEPCVQCIAPYAEGKIGRIIFAVPRSVVFEETGLMRPRRVNMHELLKDGATKTVVTQGFRADEALHKFVEWSKLRDRGLVKD